MSRQSGSSPFEAPFESAPLDYEDETGKTITLALHPLTVQLQNCNTVESINAFLQGQAQALGEFQGSDRLVKSLKNVVSISVSLSATPALRDVIGLVRLKVLMECSGSLTFLLQALPPDKAINAGLAVLLDVCSFL
jgi:hypothetical protein